MWVDTGFEDFAGSGDGVILSRDERFEADPAAVARARTFVGEVVRAAGCDESVIRSAELVVSELATNAILHARTSFVTLVEIRKNRVHIAVRDDSSVFPTPRDYGIEAATGRGLGIVAMTATRWGATAREPGGKQVWAEIGPGGLDEPVMREPEFSYPENPPPEPNQRLVVFRRVPVAQYLLLQQHNDELSREFALTEATRHQDQVSRPRSRLEELVETLHELWSPHQDQFRSVVDEAALHGDGLVDIYTYFDPEVVAPARHVLNLLEEVDEFCRIGALPVAPASPDIAALRRWFIEELSLQLGPEP